MPDLTMAEFETATIGRVFWKGENRLFRRRKGRYRIAVPGQNHKNPGILITKEEAFEARRIYLLKKLYE